MSSSIESLELRLPAMFPGFRERRAIDARRLSEIHEKDPGTGVASDAVVDTLEAIGALLSGNNGRAGKLRQTRSGCGVNKRIHAGADHQVVGAEASAEELPHRSVAGGANQLPIHSRGDGRFHQVPVVREQQDLPMEPPDPRHVIRQVLLTAFSAEKRIAHVADERRRGAGVHEAGAIDGDRPGVNLASGSAVAAMLHGRAECAFDLLDVDLEACNLRVPLAASQ